ncbi:MAG TPA: phospholipase D-like domain-containing protein [Caulobacteraceae bacterium]
MLLKAGDTCWRVERAPRAALLIDMASYFTAAKAAMLRAKRSIHLLNWAFEPATFFDPQPGCTGDEADRFGTFLKTLASERPELDVRILCWRSAIPVAATQDFFPLRARKCFAGSKVRFVLDSCLPLGACHHQKMIVIDDDVAFCGGGDIGPDRWDTPAHLDDDPRREKSKFKTPCYDSRHEVMSLVDGPPAAALGALFRERWTRATGEALADTPAAGPPEAWPKCVEPDFHDVSVGLSRTSAAWRRRPEVRESEALYLASIAAAKHCIYLENQYFTAPVMAEALADRLASPRGPDVILISTEHSPSWFDQMTMDRTRSMFIKRLKEADRYGRFHAYSPVTTLGRIIIVHAKLAIIDDQLLRIGSSNMNNRSAGFDTECDLSLEADGETEAASRTAIAAMREGLVSHWLGCERQVLQAAVARERTLGGAIEALRGAGHCRLRPIEPVKLGPLPTFIATFHLGDPVCPSDAWRPWKRRSELKRQLDQLTRQLKSAGLPVQKIRLNANAG